MRTLIASACTILALALLSNSSATEPNQDKYSIADVMQKAHKEGLMKKVASGKGSEEDVKLLLVMYEALAKNNPPKGEAESWKMKTQALIDAVKGVQKGDKAAGKALTKAANCAGCHGVHK